MEFVRILTGKARKNRRQTLAQYQREVMIRQGREQFKKLVDIGVGMPVGLL
jgi:hypothetical protein